MCGSARPRRLGEVQVRQSQSDCLDVRPDGLCCILRCCRRKPGGVDHMDLDAPSLVEKVRAVELGTSHYMATPEHFLWHAREADDAGNVSEFLSAVIVDEKSVWDYNRGVVSEDGIMKKSGPAPREPLRAIYPHDGVHVADNPAGILDGDWVGRQQRLAAQDFLAFATTEPGQSIVKASGYRTIQGKLDASVAGTGRYAETLQPLPLPKAERLWPCRTVFPRSASVPGPCSWWTSRSRWCRTPE